MTASFHTAPAFWSSSRSDNKTDRRTANVAVRTVVTFVQLLQLSLQGRKFVLVHSGRNNAEVHFYSLCSVGAFKTLQFQGFWVYVFFFAG